MKINLAVKTLLLVLGLSFLHEKSFGQLTIDSFVVFSGPNGTGTSLIGSSITINGGSVGARKLVQTTGNATINANIYSGDKVVITNSNIINGRITAANSSGSTGNILTVGSSTSISGNIDVNGNVVIGGGTVSGTVTVPVGSTYSGPAPAGGTVFGPPSLPTLPVMPDPTPFPAMTPGLPNITNSQIIPAGSYGNVIFGGNKTLTLDSAGTYYFYSFQLTGNSNKLVFNFKNGPGVFYVYIYGNADFGKLNASLTNGGNAARIYAETHGDGTGTSIPGNSFIIANGSSGGGSKWQGTVYAPFAGINIGSGTGSSTLTGTLVSSTNVTVQSGVTLEYAAFNTCSPPNVNAGEDRPLDFSTETVLTGTSATPGVSFSWQAINGGIITSDPNTATITILTAGTYILTASSIPTCFAKDTVVVSSRVSNLIGAELLSIYQSYTDPNAPPPPPSQFFQINDGYVMIDVIVNQGYYSYILGLLQTAPYGLIPPFGLNYFPDGQSTFKITGLFPIVNLLKLNLLPVEINHVTIYYQPFSSGGLVTSAGDTTVRSYLVRSGYNLDGDGFKIGVISNSFATILNGTTATLPLQPITVPPNPIPQTFNTNTFAQDIANGDLPGDTLGVVNPNGFLKNVHVLQDFPVLSSDEGRAMAQIIHDVAPAAELYFRTGFFTEEDFAVAIEQLRLAGCNVIVDDVQYASEPFLKDGIVANAVNAVTAQGVPYFSAAGNFDKLSYEKAFNPQDITALGFPGKKAHNFGGGDVFQHVRLAPGNYLFAFQWTDNTYSAGEGGTINDLDIYLTPNTNGTSLIGYNRNNTNGNPIEYIPITITGTDSADYNIFIVNNTLTSDPARIKYVAFRGGLRIMEYNEGNSTLVGHSNSDGAISIGAARFNHVPGHPLLPQALSAITKPQIESFSSFGGTFVNGVQRLKPDLVGPDGVNTTVKLGQDYPNEALDGYSGFFGTSAAAPHGAGVAALIMQGRQKFLVGHPQTSPAELKSLLQLTAVDMRPTGLVGYDFASGAGLINADSAMRTFAAPTPFQIQLVVPTNVIPGESEFILTITGQNFSNNTVIYFDDSVIQTQFVSTTELQATIGEFDGNPEIKAFTLAKTEFGDGGFSNSLFFYDADIVIKAVDTAMKYGQSVPILDTIITVNGTLLKDTNLTLADIGLDHLLLLNSVTSSSNVGSYIITPAFDPNFLPHDSLLKKYNYQFINGTLTVEQLPITITVQNETITYGDMIPDIEFAYQFNQTNIADPSALLNTIASSHQSQLAKDTYGHDIFGLVNRQAVTIVNGQALTIVNGQAVTIVNGQALTIVNGQTYPVVNAQALTIVNGVVTDINEVTLTPSQTQNLNFLVTQATLQNARQIPNQTGITNVIDITQESILDFNVNAAQTQMTNSVSNVDAKGLVGQTPYLNGQALTIVNGQALTIVNGQAVTIVNGQAVIIVNGQAVIIVNGQAIPIVNSDSRSAVILNENEIGQGLSPLKSLNILSGLEAGTQSIFPGSFDNGNFNITYVPGTLTINKAPLQVKADNITRPYGEENPPLTYTYSGFVAGQNLQTSGVTGTPDLSTTATITSPTSPPTYPITVTQGTLASENYTFNFVNGTLTVANNPCLLTHSAFKNFGNTTQVATSLWLNMTTKVSGQLSTNGDSLLFRAGSVTFNFISSTPAITNMPLPDGKIVADNTVSAPVTHYDFAKNMWITRVPVGFASTSDIFITGAIINSSNGFIKMNGNTNSVVKGMFFSNKSFSDQWAYAIAAYQPQFSYATIGGSGQVVSINGSYRAGTPLPILTNLVQGGSSGGGNNYTGSQSAYDNFTACIDPGASSLTRSTTSLTMEANNAELYADEIRVLPNPASDHINLSFVPKYSGSSKIIISALDGKRLIEIDYGLTQAGNKYLKRIDMSKLANGIYVVQVINGAKMTTKKIVVQR
jgi:hypothetical protein